MTGTLISFTKSLEDLKEEALNALRDELLEREEFEKCAFLKKILDKVYDSKNK